MTAKPKYRAVVGGVLASGLFIIGASTAVAASTGDVGAVPLSSPSDLVWNTIDSVFGEVAQIGAAILFAYGFYHLIKIGTDSGETSGSVKKLGVSWGIGIVIQGWPTLQSFVRDTGDEVGGTITPLIAEQGSNLLLAVSYLPF